jgi:hypothetical protein
MEVETQRAICFGAALLGGLLLLLVPTPFMLYKGVDTLLGYAPVWFAYIGITQIDWPWAFWRSLAVIVVHWLAVVAIFFATRRLTRQSA